MRRRRLRRRRAVRRCARFRRAGRCGRFGRRHRAVVRLCAPFRRAGVRDDEYVGFCRRTARGRTHRPRSMPRGRRCADRAGYGFSADGSSAGRVARLDADVYDDSRPGAVLERRRFFEDHSRARCDPGGDTRDCRRGSGHRDRDVRARGDLRRIQRAVLPEPFDVAAQRQPRSLLAGVPAGRTIWWTKTESG